MEAGRKIERDGRGLPAEEAVAHAETKAIGGESIGVLDNGSGAGVEGRGSGEGGPDLILIIAAKQYLARQRKLNRPAGRIREVAAFEAAGRGEAGSGNEAAAHQQFEPEAEVTIVDDSVAAAGQVVGFDLAVASVPVQPARFALGSPPGGNVQIEECGRADQLAWAAEGSIAGAAVIGVEGGGFASGPQSGIPTHGRLRTLRQHKGGGEKQENDDCGPLEQDSALLE